MLPLRPTLIIQSSVASSGYVQAARTKRSPPRPYTSSFRSLLLDMQIYSSSIKVVKQHVGVGSLCSYPVFGHQDKIEGKVMLDPSCSKTGHLTLSLEGALEYSSPQDNADDRYPCGLTVMKHRHVFLSTSAAIPFLPTSDSRSTIREALSVRKRPSTSSLNSPACRSCEFSFELPRGSRPDEEIPSTCSYKTPTGGLDNQSYMEELEVTYRITAIWESSDGYENHAILEAPVLFQPDVDFQSLDGVGMVVESWSEIPLVPERPIPFHCVVTLPRCRSFSRYSSIPYFVAFSTNTRSPSLVEEIAADATIAISLVRRIKIPPQSAPQASIRPDTPPTSDESDSPASSFPVRSKLFRLSVRTPTRYHTRKESYVTNKPLPKLPLTQEAFSTSRTLQTQVSIGFPKRPRANIVSQGLPDGFCKGKVQLPKDIIPSVDWSGFSVEYHLDFSVLVGQDDVRTRVPIRVY